MFVTGRIAHCSVHFVSLFLWFVYFEIQGNLKLANLRRIDLFSNPSHPAKAIASESDKRPNVCSCTSHSSQFVEIYALKDTFTTVRENHV